jgi:hypothetical protein
MLEQDITWPGFSPSLTSPPRHQTKIPIIQERETAGAGLRWETLILDIKAPTFKIPKPYN